MEGLSDLGIGIPDSSDGGVSLDVLVEQEADRLFTSGNVEELKNTYDPSVVSRILDRHSKKYGGM